MSQEGFEKRLEFIDHQRIFAHFTPNEQRFLAFLSSTKSFAHEQVVIEEQSETEELYLIVHGIVGIYQKSELTGEKVPITELGPGELLGELSLSEEHGPTSATVIAKEKATLLVFEKAVFANMGQLELAVARFHQECKIQVDYNAIYAKLYEQFFKVLVHRVRITSVFLNQKHSQQIIAARKLLDLSNFLIFTMMASITYIMFLAVLRTVTSMFASTTGSAVLVLLLYFFFARRFIKHSELKASEFGLTLRGWKFATLDALRWTVPILIFLIAMKWYLITYIAEYASEPLFNPLAALNPEERRPESFYLVIFFGVIYTVFVFFQELIGRGIAQTAMAKLLQTEHREVKAIFFGSLLFSASHSHLSLKLTLATFVFGLFFGWLYNRHTTLVGVVLSHAIIGVFAFFVLGLESILA